MDFSSCFRRVAVTSALCGLVFFLGRFGYLTEFWEQSHIASFLTYLETGRNVRFFPSLEAISPYFVESPPASLPEPEPGAGLPHYEKIPEIWNQSGVSVDLEVLLSEPLQWRLLTAEPTVLILHTHTTESYTQKNEPYVQVSAWRTLDPNYNMCAMGAETGRLLTAAGISVVHSDAVHDYPSYNGSYVRARKTLTAALAENPSVQLVLDLHRDASGEEGKQLRPVAQRDGETAARLMLVVGTNHENYEQNLSLALKLHAQLEQQWPGIMRPVQLRSSRFNQDLHPGALLVEIGAAGNSHEEARTAARELAKAIIALSNGTASITPTMAAHEG